jgi:hypothetical protein
MATYHPPKMITSNAAPAITADLAYEVNGKCGCETIILGDNTNQLVFDAANESENIEGCLDNNNGWKMVALENTNFRRVRASNLSERSTGVLETGFSFKKDSEILANFSYVEIVSGTVIIYRDCNQS